MKNINNPPVGERLGYCCDNLSIPGNWRTVTMNAIRGLTEKRIKEILTEVIRHNLDRLTQILYWNMAHRIWCYRIPSGIFPFLDHPDFHGFTETVLESKGMEKDLELTRCAVRSYLQHYGNTKPCGYLTTHPGQYCVISSRDEAVNKAGRFTLEAHRKLLMYVYPYPYIDHASGLINIHVSNGSKPHQESVGIVERNLELLSPGVLDLLTFENEDRGIWTPSELLASFPKVPVVLDLHHLECNPDPLLGREEAVTRVVARWQEIVWGTGGADTLEPGKRQLSEYHPIMHISAPLDPDGTPLKRRQHAARLTGRIPDLPFQFIEIEAKDKDLALLDYRERFPDA